MNLIYIYLLLSTHVYNSDKPHHANMASNTPLLSVETILADFEPAPHVSNPPLYEEIADLRRVIGRNATTIRSLRGGGHHGHLAITMTPAEYDRIAPGTPFAPPATPVNTFTIPAGTSQVQAANLRKQYLKDCAEFNLYLNATKALKKQINDAVPTEFLDDIRDDYVGLANLTIPEIFDHIFDQPSGEVTEDDVEECRQSIEQQKYSLEEELAVYYKWLMDYQQYAQQGGEEVTNSTIMNIALRHIRATGHFNKACREWKAKPAAQKTWANFKTHFNKARKEAKQDAAISGAAYQAANQLLLAQQDARLAAMQAETQRIQQENQRTISEMAERMNNIMQAKPTPPAPLQGSTAYNIQHPYYPPPYNMYGPTGTNSETAELKP